MRTINVQPHTSLPRTLHNTRELWLVEVTREKCFGQTHPQSRCIFLVNLFRRRALYYNFACGCVTGLSFPPLLLRQTRAAENNQATGCELSSYSRHQPGHVPKYWPRGTGNTKKESNSRGSGRGRRKLHARFHTPDEHQELTRTSSLRLVENYELSPNPEFPFSARTVSLNYLPSVGASPRSFTTTTTTNCDVARFGGYIPYIKGSSPSVIIRTTRFVSSE